MDVTDQLRFLPFSQIRTRFFFLDSVSFASPMPDLRLMKFLLYTTFFEIQMNDVPRFIE